MLKQELFKKYLIFLFGLFINSLGVAFITKADLGTSPISSIPYTLSLGFNPTIGQYTIIFSLFLIVIQIILLKKEFGCIQFLQIPVSILFGYFIDFSMNRILFWMEPENYGLKFLFLILGCLILGAGVFMEVMANVIMLPGEGVVRAINFHLNKEFGLIKICVDLSMCIIAVILALFLFHEIRGVGPGTIIAALLVGYISRMYSKLFEKLSQRNKISNENTEESIEHLITTIAGE